MNTLLGVIYSKILNLLPNYDIACQSQIIELLICSYFAINQDFNAKTKSGSKMITSNHTKLTISFFGLEFILRNMK